LASSSSPRMLHSEIVGVKPHDHSNAQTTKS
jgi:hypothetical protein